MLVFATSTVAYVIRFIAPSPWRPKIHRLALRLSSLGFAVFGATYVSAGANPDIGWLLIAVATVGSVAVPPTPNTGRRATGAAN